MADIRKAAENLKKLGYAVQVFETKEQAADYLDTAIDGVTVGIGGSQTVQVMGLYDRLSTHNEVHWHWINGEGERKLAMNAKVYLTSANALAETGEIVNIDGAGNRVSSTLFGHEKVCFIVGRNKLAEDYDAALWRARNVAAPKRAASMGKKTPCAVKVDKCYDCKSPERICRGLTVLWAPMMGFETEIILIDEDLGM
ncbi:MAG: lactate utilization protein [Oscillibacter sp.]|nr:lactate utilization protein [Oscillibacter sp.]